MTLETILLIITSIISGASIVLKVVAPLTKNTLDDKAYILFVKILRFLAIDSNYSTAKKTETVKY